ncbi:exported protein of unknown function [Candidatus Filomicrobium marinum]|nr:exported protein of unknown function [Candidatus Filomicrobium marinum]
MPVCSRLPHGMNRIPRISFTLAGLLFAVMANGLAQAHADTAHPWPTNEVTETLQQRIAPPPGFRRVPLPENSLEALCCSIRAHTNGARTCTRPLSTSMSESATFSNARMRLCVCVPNGFGPPDKRGTLHLTTQVAVVFPLVAGPKANGHLKAASPGGAKQRRTRATHPFGAT